MVGSGEVVVDSSTESVEGGKDALGVGVHSGWQADASQGLVGLLGRVEVGEDGQEMRGESSTSTVGEFVDPEMPVGVLVNSPSENVSGRQQKKLTSDTFLFKIHIYYYKHVKIDDTFFC